MDESLKRFLFFAVTKGHHPGVFTSWEEANEQVANFTFPEFECFNSYEHASMCFKSRMSCISLQEAARAEMSGGNRDALSGNKSSLFCRGVRRRPVVASGYAKLPLIPPYLHPGYNHYQYIYGVNFASAGAGALVETNKGAVVDLKTRSFYFGEVSKQLRQDLGEEEADKMLSKAVYIFSIGGNDYAAPFYSANSSTAPLPYPPQQFVDFVIGNISSVIKDIYNEGGRKFGFLNVYPLGCIPLLRILIAGNSFDDCLQQEATVLARLHNNQLPKNLQKLEKELSGFKYSLTDIYAAFLDHMENPSKYGFKVGSEACCGGGRYGGDYSCGGKRGIETYHVCSNANDYVLFDAAHPTDKAAKHISQIMWIGGDTHPKQSSYNLKQLFQL